MIARIAPLDPPYAPDVRTALDKWMPPGAGVEPLKLFRTLARHERLSDRMRGLGAALLGRGLLPARVRELLILRTCARCGAEYEWGVHVTAFSSAAGLSDAIVHDTARRPPSDVEARDDDDSIVMRLADELHDSSTVSSALWKKLAARFDDAQLLEMIAIAGFYHLISFTVNATAVEREAWASSFPAR